MGLLTILLPFHSIVKPQRSQAASAAEGENAVTKWIDVINDFDGSERRHLWTDQYEQDVIESDQHSDFPSNPRPIHFSSPFANINPRICDAACALMLGSFVRACAVTDERRRGADAAN